MHALGLLPTEQLSFILNQNFNPSPSSSHGPDFVQVAASLPFIWIAFALLLSAIRHTYRWLERKTQGHALRVGKFTSFVRYFDVYIQESDILSAMSSEDEGVPESTPSPVHIQPLPPPPAVLAAVPLAEAVRWSGTALRDVLEAYARPEWNDPIDIARSPPLLFPILYAVTWFLAFCQAIASPRPLPRYSHLILFTFFLASSMIVLSEVLHLYLQPDSQEALSSLALPIFDVVCCVTLVAAMLQMPLDAPLESVNLDRARASSFIRPRSPEDTNTLMGAITYAWMNPLMSLARTRGLQPTDIWALALKNRCQVLSRRFSALTEPTLLGRLLHACARDIVIDISGKMITVILGYLRPFMVQKILENLSATSLSTPPSPTSTWTPREQAYVFALFAFVSIIARGLTELQHYHYARRIGMRLRSEVTVAIFEKILRRKDMAGRSTSSTSSNGVDGEEEKEGDTNASVGRVVSLASEDVNRLLRTGCDAHLLWGCPLGIVVSLVYLYRLLGWSGLVGFGLLILAVPINFWLGKRSIKIAQGRASSRDKRQASMAELITAIRTIKFFGWSSKWMEQVETKRSDELLWMVEDWKNRFYFTALWTIISLLVPLASFFCYVKLAGNELTVAVAFTALSIFAMARTPLIQIPEWAVRLIQVKVSIQRLESFFAEEEVAVHATPAARSESSGQLGFSKATLRWHTKEASEAGWQLSDLSVEFVEGLNVISGPTASGKTSLLLGLLGELEVVSGEVHLPPTVSYAGQHPWLESASIRANILYGTPLQAKRYKAVLEACALLPDLAQLQDNDLTHIGQRGVSLSGGQRARIALARAMYSPASFVLLDDVLSAVDSYTANHLLRALVGPIMKGRTVVLVTHHVDLVFSSASYHVELLDGQVVKAGRLDPTVLSAPPSSKEATEAQEENRKMVTDEDEPDLPAEGWATGEVQQSIYNMYLTASSYLLWMVLFIFILARPVASFMEQFWLRKWGEASDRHQKVDATFYLIVYACIGLAGVFVALLSTAVLYVASLRASRIIFKNLLHRVVQAPQRWFDITPQGRITNRFTVDIGTVDEALAGNFNDFGINFVGMVAALGVTTFIVPATFVPIAIFSFIYFITFVRYLGVNRDVNRIAASTASPIFSGFQEVLIGISTVRAFGKEKTYRDDLCALIDDTLSMWYCTATLDVWLSIRTQMLSACCFLSTAVFAIYAGVSPGLVGIAIISSQTVMQSFDWLCSAYGRLVTSLNSLERITEYLELSQEPQGGSPPPATWPSSNCSGPLISVEKLQMKYSPELPTVLQGITFSVNPRERVAIVGRTGSGKSTLAMSLLRFMDPESGSIVIDGIDVTQVPLEDLRQRVSFLPQDATLFEGTVRSNLDPFTTHSDEACVDALRRVHLQPTSSTTSGTATPLQSRETGSDTLGSGGPERYVNLDMVVSAGGGNFSAGQRQLIAVARALLRDSRIIIFDESTAAIDFQLDAAIQRTIRTEFQDACLITIAHRLRTIMDYDRVLVLETGKILQFDSPKVLVGVEGEFQKLCRETGHFEELVRMTR